MAAPKPLMEPSLPFTPITIRVSQDVQRQLSQLASEANTTEAQLVETAVRRLIDSRRRPAIPRYARRLGPLAD